MDRTKHRRFVLLGLVLLAGGMLLVGRQWFFSKSEQLTSLEADTVAALQGEAQLDADGPAPEAEPASTSAASPASARTATTGSLRGKVIDALTRRRMHGFLLEIWQRTGKTIVFVTHDIAEAVALADRICVMSLGPGSRITEVIPVALPRPRDLSDPHAARVFKHVEKLLG